MMNTLVSKTNRFASIIENIRHHAEALNAPVEISIREFNDLLTITYTVLGWNANNELEYESFSTTFYCDDFWKRMYNTSVVNSYHYYSSVKDDVLTIEYTAKVNTETSVTAKYNIIKHE